MKVGMRVRLDVVKLTCMLKCGEEGVVEKPHGVEGGENENGTLLTLLGHCELSVQWCEYHEICPKTFYSCASDI